MGADFELDTVRRASIVDETALIGAIEEAVRSGLLVEEPGRGLAYRFAHELVRRAVDDRLSAARRAEIHLRVAEALEHGWSGSDSRAVLAALAHHYAAGGAGRRSRAGRRVQPARGRVGRRRARVRRGGGSVSHRARARRPRSARAREGDAPARRRLPSRRPCRLRARRVRAYRRAGALAGRRRAPRARRDRLRGGVLAPGDPRRRGGRAARGGGRCAPAATTPSSARARSADSHARSTYAASRAALRSSRATRRSRCRGAAATAGTLGTTLAQSYWSRGSSTNEEVNSMLLEALELGRELDDVEIEGEALSWLVPSHVVLRDHDSATEALAQLFGVARRLSQPFLLHVAEHYAGALSLCDGDLAAAEARRPPLAGVGEAPHRQGRVRHLRDPDVRHPSRAGASRRAGSGRTDARGRRAKLRLEARARRALQRARDDGRRSP